VRAVEKPFVILLNTRRLGDPEVEALAEQLADRYGAPVLPVDVARLDEDDLLVILEELLYEFPVTELNVRLPRWVEELDADHWLRRHYEEAVEEAVHDVRKLRDVDGAVGRLAGYEHVASARVSELDLGTGSVSLDVHASDDLFWRVTEEVSGFRID